MHKGKDAQGCVRVSRAIAANASICRAWRRVHFRVRTTRRDDRTGAIWRVPRGEAAATAVVTMLAQRGVGCVETTFCSTPFAALAFHPRANWRCWWMVAVAVCAARMIDVLPARIDGRLARLNVYPAQMDVHLRRLNICTTSISHRSTPFRASLPQWKTPQWKTLDITMTFG